jgi:hypothetical protein
MKKLSLLIVGLISVLILNAHVNHHSVSDFNLKLWNNGSFKIFIDNQQYGYDSFFKLQNIAPGKHHIKVLLNKYNHHGNGGFTKVLYNGAINIPANSIVSALVTPNRNIKLKITNKGHNHYNGTNGHVNSNGCGNMNSNVYSYIQPMDASSFNGLLSSVDNTNFDSSKITIIKQALTHNYLSTNQVIMLINQFSFDSSKLKIAKLAYVKTVDQENYFLVNNSFTFNSSITSLSNYINNFS